MSVSFGLNHGLVAARTAPDTYGTPVDIPYIQMMNASLRLLSAEGVGDDKIPVVASRVSAGQMQVRMLGAPFAVLEVVLGIADITTGSGGTLVRTIRVPGGHRLPAFGILGVGLNEENLGDQLIFAANCKITSDITIMSMEYGQLNNLEFTIMCVDDDDYGILNLVERATAGAVDLPPDGIVEA